jgi:hypothetical protein
MKNKRTLHIGDTAVWAAIINKSLEKYNLSMDDILKKQYIEGVEWYTYYTITQQEAESLKEWAYKYIKDNVISHGRLARAKFNKMFDYYDLQYGLKIENNE